MNNAMLFLAVILVMSLTKLDLVLTMHVMTPTSAEVDTAVRSKLDRRQSVLEYLILSFHLPKGSVNIVCAAVHLLIY